jgi:hypothetical protein
MKTQLNEIKRMQQLAGVINENKLNSKSLNENTTPIDYEKDVYITAGTMIPQIGPATPKNSEKYKGDERREFIWNNWVGNEDEEKLMNVTDEYYKWLGSELLALEKMHKSGPYQMHLASLKSGGSSRSNHDFLGMLIETMKFRKEDEKRYR